MPRAVASALPAFAVRLGLLAVLAGLVSGPALGQGFLQSSDTGEARKAPEARLLEPPGDALLQDLSEADVAKVHRLQKQTPADSENYRNHYELANLYYDAKLWDRSEARYLRSLEVNPRFAEAMVNLGSLYEETNRTDEAIREYEAALRIDPEDCKARSNLGNAYYSQKRYPDAMYEYHRALDINPECYPALFNLAAAFADVGIYREAVKYWRDVVRVAPGTEAARQAQDNVDILESFVQKPVPAPR